MRIAEPPIEEIRKRLKETASSRGKTIDPHLDCINPIKDLLFSNALDMSAYPRGPRGAAANRVFVGSNPIADSRKTEMSDNTRTFTLNKVEHARLTEFEEEHEKKHGRCRAAAGGRFSVEFTITSIGDGKTAKCGACKETKDITDYECW